MTTNELKKGTRVELSNGWLATLLDNMKGNTRLARVEGIFTECGSIYSHDIVAAEINGEWTTDISYTPAQLACKLRADAFG